MAEVVAELLSQGHGPQVRRIPAGIQSPVKALQNHRRAAAVSQALAPMVRMGVDLNFNAPGVGAVAGGTGEDLPL